MKYAIACVLVFLVSMFFLLVGMYLGMNDTKRELSIACEQAVATAAINKKPFIFLDGRPVVIYETRRIDGTVIYWAIMD